MDQHDLRAFLAVSSNLHFGRAGREVNLSPSALSRTIRRLEEEVGERLFVRDTRAVELTAGDARCGATPVNCSTGGRASARHSRTPARPCGASFRSTAPWPPRTPCSPA